MMVLIAYDVNTETSQGRSRLRKVAKQCVNYGHRVQNSVFECVLDESQFRTLKHKLHQIIEPTTDSLRYYRLGEKYESKIETDGRDCGLSVEGSLIF